MNNNKIWGPQAWTFLHTITLNYPDNPTNQDKNNYYSFFSNLKHVLPCEKCKNHYNENFNKYNLEQNLNSKDDLVKWLIDIHNEVNKSNDKKIWTYDEVYNEYNNIYNPSNTVNNIIIFVIILIFFIFIFFLFNIYADKKISCK